MGSIKVLKVVFAILILLVAGGVSACGTEPIQNEVEDANTKSELSSLPVSEIKKVFVYVSKDKEVQLNSDEELDVIKALSTVEFSGSGTLDYADYDGIHPLMFRLELKNGEMIDFAACSPFYIIDSLGYTAGHKVCASIENMYWQLYEKYFFENLE